MRTTRSRLSTQRGGVLVVSLILLFSFTLLVLGTSQQLLVEQRISTNLNDRQQALQHAQLALQVATETVDKLNPQLDQLAPLELFGATGIFTRDCTNQRRPNGLGQGLCLSAQQERDLAPAAERRSDNGKQPTAILAPCGHAIEYVLDLSARAGCRGGKVSSGKLLWANPRYLVELVDDEFKASNHASGRLYRITARAWGRSRHTEVTLQRYHFIPKPAAEMVSNLLPPIESETP